MMAPKRRREEDEEPQKSNGSSGNSGGSSSGLSVQKTTSGDDVSTKKPTGNNSRFVLDVGGTLFYTSKQTLINGSSFFAAALTHFAEGAADRSEEFYVDRNPKSFHILLDYMRSGVLLCDADTKLLAYVVLEADFYGMDQLLYEVKEQCYVHLFGSQMYYPMPPFAENEKVNEMFPMVRDLVQHCKFPQIYYGMDNCPKIFNKVLSSYALPENTFVEIQQEDGKHTYLRAHEMATIESHTGEIFTEPMVRCEVLYWDWRHIRFKGCKCDADAHLWPRRSDETETPLSQIAPISFFLNGLPEEEEDEGEWYGWKMVTRELLPAASFDPEQAQRLRFTVYDGKEVNEEGPAFVEVVTGDDMRTKAKWLSYDDGRLVEVTKLSGFIGFA